MIGSMANALSGFFNRLLLPRSATKAISVPSTVVPAAVSKAKNKVFHATPQLTPDETGLLGCFRTDDPLSHETLSELSGLDPGELATLLVGLELAGAVRQLPGNRYMKLI